MRYWSRRTIPGETGAPLWLAVGTHHHRGAGLELWVPLAVWETVLSDR